MIRLFLDLCKCFQKIKNNNDYQIYIDYKNSVAHKAIPCPFDSCSATGSYYSCGSYTRTLICYINDSVERYEIVIDRVECVSCEHSHAVLPSVIIPYSPFSFHFVVSLLYDYITHKYCTVSELCLKYDISISTLYRIYNRFIEDRKLMIGMMEAASKTALQFLENLANSDFYIDIDYILYDFYKKYRVSFLQARCKLRLSRNSLSITQAFSP